MDEDLFGFVMDDGVAKVLPSWDGEGVPLFEALADAAIMAHRSDGVVEVEGLTLTPDDILHIFLNIVKAMDEDEGEEDWPEMDPAEEFFGDTDGDW